MNKKRLILLILAAVLAVFTMGCQFQEEAPSLEVDDVAIYFGVSSFFIVRLPADPGEERRKKL